MPTFLARYAYNVTTDVHERATAEHVQFLRSAVGSGHVVAAGAAANRPYGFVLLKCDDIVQADLLLQTDPVISQGGATIADLVEWGVDIGLAEFLALT